MRTLLLAGLFAMCCFEARADFVTYTTSASDMATADGNHFNFSGLLEVPQFDPDLGVLTAFSFNLAPTGFIIWDVASISNNSTKSWFLVGNTAFLGMESPAFSKELLGPTICIPSGGSPCGHAFQSISYLGVYLTMKGTLTDGLYSFTGWDQGPISLGTRPGDLSEFVGTSSLRLPVSTALSVSHSNDVVATVQPQQAIDWNLSLTYNFTPSASEVPEPRWTAVFLLAIFVIGALVRHGIFVHFG